MIDDDAHELLDFRREVAAPDEETTRRVYARATQRSDRRRHSLWSNRRRSPRLAVGLAAAAVLALPAVAFGGKLVDLFQGAPPTPAVSSAYRTLNRVASEATRLGMAAKLATADLSKLHGVIEMTTADGPVDLWTAPNDRGGQCWFVDFADDPASASGQAGSGSCDEATPPATNVTVASFRDLIAHPSLAIVFGRVYADARSVELTLADGSTLKLPVIEGFFLGSATDIRVTTIAAYDAAGNTTATWAEPS